MLFGHCAFKKADMLRAYLSSVSNKNLQVGNIVGMGFDGAATLSGK